MLTLPLIQSIDRSSLRLHRFTLDLVVALGGIPGAFFFLSTSIPIHFFKPTKFEVYE